tara:strand:+ start:144 stop:668 length:525 start_codon:yes stop_codon:yes gene_type:complete
MAKTLVLSFIANDETGIVDRVTEIVSEAGGNWSESRMAHLAEKFAGVARVTIPDAKAGNLQAALINLEEEGFHLIVEEASDPAPLHGGLLTLDFIGPDHPGILHEISHCLAENCVSVETMRTQLEAAPMGGGQLFHATGQVRMPAGMTEEKLRQALEALAAALMVDISLVDKAD